MDQISGLPRAILHDILSRLRKKDCVRTSVLSKAWREIWNTFPVLSICDQQFIEKFSKVDEDFLRKRKIFLDYVKKKLLWFRDQGLAIKEFKLILINCAQHYMSQDIDLWIQLAIESGVEVLGLCRRFGGSRSNVDQCYTFPAGVLEAKSLEKLVLMSKVRLDKMVLNHSAKDFSLRVLHLRSVLFGDEGIIEHLISRCPLIEQITLEDCYVCNPLSKEGPPKLRTFQLKSSSMNGLKKLKGVDIVGIQEVYIDAPNLENLSYRPDDGFAPFKLNFDSCRNLRQLYLAFLKSIVIADMWLLELFSNCPFIESLKLHSCSLSERINISSAQLKVLELMYCSNLKEVNIDAPNLLSYSCGCTAYGASKPVIYFLRSSSKLELNVRKDMEFLDLYDLREIIQNFKPQKVLASLSLRILVSHVAKPIPDVFQVSSHLPSVKHLNLDHLPGNEDLYLPLVNLLLSSCCPETISFTLNSRGEAFAKLLLETLTGRNRDKCYCSSGHIKCWWHDLKNVKVTRSVETTYFDHLLGEKTTLLTRKTISFRLEL